jgi:hypothetical protein
MRKLVAAVLAAALTLSFARGAAAKSCGGECARAIADVVVFVARHTTTADFDARTSYYFAPPAVPYVTPSYEPGRLSPPGLAMTGFSLDALHVTDDHLLLPMLGFGMSFPLESWNGLSSADGAGTFHFDTRLAYTVLLPGIGYRVQEGNWTFSGMLQTALIDFYTSGRYLDIASGESSRISSDALSFAVRGEFSACDRLDDAARLCAFVSPNVYEYSWANGGSIGLRLEMGK